MAVPVTKDSARRIGKVLSFVRNPEGIKINWESWVGGSEMPWEEFPADAETGNQVLIEKSIANGWLLETAKTP